MYDAQGNSFDPQAALLNLQAGFRVWAAGGPMTRHVFPNVAAAREAYAGVLSYVRGRGLAGADHPFPHDIREWLMSVDSESQFSQTPGVDNNRTEGTLAAEHGSGCR